MMYICEKKAKTLSRYFSGQSLYITDNFNSSLSTYLKQNYTYGLTAKNRSHSIQKHRSRYCSYINRTVLLLSTSKTILITLILGYARKVYGILSIQYIKPLVFSKR